MKSRAAGEHAKGGETGHPEPGVLSEVEQDGMLHDVFPSRFGCSW
jgi:hypothetical protein